MFATCAPSTPGLLPALLGQRHDDGRVPVDALLEVQRRLRVAGEQEEQAYSARRASRSSISISSKVWSLALPRAPRATEIFATVAASGASTMFRKS